MRLRAHFRHYPDCPTVSEKCEEDTTTGKRVSHNFEIVEEYRKYAQLHNISINGDDGNNPFCAVISQNPNANVNANLNATGSTGSLVVPDLNVNQHYQISPFEPQPPPLFRPETESLTTITSREVKLEPPNHNMTPTPISMETKTDNNKSRNLSASSLDSILLGETTNQGLFSDIFTDLNTRDIDSIPKELEFQLSELSPLASRLCPGT